jgi:hypothetical protein
MQIAENKGLEPELKELEVIVTADKIVRLAQHHFENTVIPFMVNHPSVLREMLTEKNHVMTQLENKINQLLHRTLDGNSMLGG